MNIWTNVCVCVTRHRAVEHHAVSIAQALDVRCQVEADCPMANGIHGLSIKEVMRSGWTSRKNRREESSACA